MTGLLDQPLTREGEWLVYLPYRRIPFSLNDRPAPHERNRINTEIKTTAFVMAKKAGVPPLAAVTIELVYYPGRNAKVDGENLAPTLKACIDGLVIAKILPDDNSERVLSARCRAVIRRNDPYDCSTPRMVLVIQDASALAPLPNYPPEG